MSTKTADPEPAPGRAMPDEFSPRHLRARVLQLGLLVVVVVAIIWATPGLSSLRDELKDASGGWFVLAIAFEIASTLSYVVIFRAVFCPRMSWRMSYQIGMAEQAANSVLSVSGAGGLALGARSEEHTSELQSRPHLVCRLLLEKKKQKDNKDAMNQHANLTRV